MRTIATFFLTTLSLGAAVAVAGCGGSGGDEALGASAEALTTTTEMLCESDNYGYDWCDINVPDGRIVGARVAHQLSSAPCREGSSWGYDAQSIWVDRGCQAVFAVRIWSPDGPTPSTPEITLYQDPNFGGNTRTLRSTVFDFDSIGFDNKTSSIIVRSGYWELCQHDWFEGACLTFRPGRYPTLTMDDSFGSARPR